MCGWLAAVMSDLGCRFLLSKQNQAAVCVDVRSVNQRHNVREMQVGLVGHLTSTYAQPFRNRIQWFHALSNGIPTILMRLMQGMHVSEQHSHRTWQAVASAKQVRNGPLYT